MTPRFPRMGSKDVERLLKQNGYFEKRQKGSHRIFWHPKKRISVPVPMGKKDLPMGTLRSILVRAGIKIKEEEDQ